MAPKRRSFPDPIRFSQGLDLWGATARGLEVMVVAVAFVLLGDAVAAAGPLSVLALLLVALLVLVNHLSYASLAARTPRLGRAYALVHGVTAGGGLAFFTGWLLVLAGLGLCGLLAQGAARYLAALLADLFGLVLPLGALALLLIALMGLVNSLRRPAGRHALFSLILVLLLVAAALLAVPQIRVSHYRLDHPQLGAAMTVLLAAFVGLEVIAGRQHEIRYRTVKLSHALIVALGLTALLGAGLAAVVVGLVGSPTVAQSGVALSLVGEAAAGQAGRVAVLALGTVALLLALRRGLAMVVRRIYRMSRDGYWPAWLRRPFFRRGIPLWLIVLVVLLALPLVVVDLELLSRVSGLFYLLALVLVNLTIVLRLSRQNGLAAPAASSLEVSSSGGMPLYLWLPGLALLLDLVMIFMWGWRPLAVALAFLALGGLIYLTYGQSHRRKVQEGVTVFRPPQEERLPPAAFRVLVPIANPATAGALLRMAGQIARSQGGEVLALQVVIVPELVPLESGRLRARFDSALLEQALVQANEEGWPIRTMTRVARSVNQGIVDTAVEEKANLILIGWRGPIRPRGASLGSVVDAVLRDAPSDVLIMQGKSDTVPKRILVPTAGGPHARVAARLAKLLSEAWDAEVTLLYVQRGPATPEQMESNRRRLAETLEGLSWERPPEQKLVQAADVLEGIVQEARSYDLVLLGVSEESLLDQFVFGNLPFQVAARVPAAALVQGYRGLTELWTNRLVRALRAALPALGQQERLEVYQELDLGAQPGVNYFVLIVLSCIIAALGLLLNSPAVVIGAMLVAPLMSPILAFSLGLILGDLRLIRFSLETILYGIALSVAIAALIGFFSPLKIVTAEMQARAQPTLLDMGVALASGMAGAYAVARKDVSAALPGVAIAAALMPPLATVGLAFSLGEARIAGGALLLFVTNIAAMSLAGGVVFLLLGIRPQEWGPESIRHLRQRLIASLLLLLVIAVPLGFVLRGVVVDIAQERIIRDVLTEQLAAQDVRLVSLEVDREHESLLVVVTVRSPQVLDQHTVGELAQLLAERLDQPVRLEIIVLPVVRSDGTSGLRRAWQLCRTVLPSRLLPGAQKPDGTAGRFFASAPPLCFGAPAQNDSYQAGPLAT